MSKPGRTIIACGSIRSELENAREKSGIDVTLIFMPQNFHRKPEKMTPFLQERINRESEKGKMVILGYGLCSGGTAGLKAPEYGLVIPKIHDCISMYLGSNAEYKRIFKHYPGTYFLTRNWIDNQLDPKGLVNNEYTKRVGYEMAKEAMETELKNYKYIAYIDTTGSKTDKYRNIAKENARIFNKEFIELKGSDKFFISLLKGPYDNENFLKFKYKEISNHNHFLK